MRSLVAVALLAGLCACAPDAAEEARAPAAEATAAASQPAAEASVSAADAATIPAAYFGVWDFVEGSCDPASDLRMDISADQIVMYESVGMVTAVSPSGADSVIVSLAMAGEGETWTEELRLTLQDGGDSLLPEQTDAEQGTAMQRKRCPA